MPIDGQHIQNDLDRQLRMFREVELHYIVKSARKLREMATDVNEALSEAETFLALLRNLAVEVSGWGFLGEWAGVSCWSGMGLHMWVSVA